MNESRSLQGFGSDLFGSIRAILKPFLNQRGQLGTEGDAGAGDNTNPGADPLEMNPDANQESDPSPGEQQPPEGEGDPPAAEPLNTELDQPPEGQDPQTPADTAFHKSQRFQEMNTSLKDTQAQLEQIQTQLEQANQVAQFYQTQFNESQGLGPDGQPTGQPASTQPTQQAPATMPDDIVGPGEWSDQEQQGAWTEHVVNTRVEQRLQDAYQTTLLPMLTQLSNAISAMQMNTAKSGKDDFDDVIAEVNKGLFQIGPDGKVYGVQNPAMLNYFKTQSNPYEAMYRHGLSNRAPQKIKEGVQKQTKKALKKLSQQPRGPIQPAGGDGEGAPAELGWDTPPEQAEQILHKRRLI